MRALNAKLLKVTDEEYHADPCPEPSLSQSTASVLVGRSPAHAWLQHPRLGGVRSEATREMNVGTLVHAELLGTKSPACVIRRPDYRTKVAQEERDAAVAMGLVPILEREWERVQTAVTALRPKLEALGIRFSGESEVAVQWEEHFLDGTRVYCRGKADHVLRAENRIIDVKKTVSAHPGDVARALISYGYDIQRAAYVRAFEALYPDMAGRTEFVFAFVEVEPPYEVTPAVLDGPLREIGEARWERACALWARCLKTNRWPGYAEGIVTLEAPGWAVAKELGTTI